MTDTKTMLITGAGSGIGRGLARMAAGDNFHVIACDLDLASAEKTVAILSESGMSSEALRVDVTCKADIDKLIDTLGLGGVDVLVNNAGLQYVSCLENFPQDKWDLLIRVILNGTCMMTRAVIPGMRDRGFGRIINIGSIHSLVASPFKSAYVAAKHGLLGFSKAIALETADTDITINTICSSYVRTPLLEQQIVAQATEHGITEAQVVDEIMLKPMPKGTFIEMDELFGIVAFLTSAAARNITGQTIVVDGGWTAR